MKLLFIGSLINDKTIDTIVKNSKVKPSNAPVNFENMLIKGLEEASVDTTVLSVPTVSVYPKGSLLAWGRKKEVLNFGKEVTWIPCINLLFLKQLCVTVNCYIEVFRWLFRNRKDKDKLIMTYSVYPPYSRPAQRLGRLFKTKTCCMVTDLPEYLYKMGKQSVVQSILTNHYSKKMVRCQSKYDLYVYLTEHMADRMGTKSSPSIIMEGFSDASIFDGIDSCKKNKRKTLMYAGRLSEDFNIRTLLDAFLQIEGDYELWLFGSGDMVDYINECAAKDNRITYFGKVDRKTLLEHQKAAHLLVSVKSSEEDHANYAFPSKILEYMVSGTAVASTTVGGIPKEYFDYIYPIKGNDVEAIRDALKEILETEASVLQQQGEKAREYATTEKKYSKQAKRIVDFLSEQI